MTVKIEDSDALVERSLRDYGRYVAEDRALCSLQDGLKPVQRRILWTVWDRLKLKPGSTSKRSARVTGEVTGCFHPHGDCLDGSTLVYSLDGKTYSLRHLTESGKEYLWVLACDSKGYLHPAKAHSFRIGQLATRVYSIHLSDGSLLRCTGNHPFMVRGVGWVSARDIAVGAPLLSGELLASGYPRVKLVGESTKYIHRIVDCLCVTKVSVSRLGAPESMYDFTVDNYENLMVVTGGRDSSFTVVSAHNSATYGALVNLTWQRYPLLAGQGNFGDPLADLPPAAPRYTGVLASSLLPEMFRDQAVTLLEPNYTGEFQEPTFIPTRLPILLLNGSEGIAVGVSARIPPHNLKAVVATLKKELRDPKASLATLSKILGGPDYPEGGILLSSASDLLELHKTGKGSLIFQCAYDIECVKNGYHLIVESGCPHWNLATFVERCQTLVAENELGWVANESGETIKVVCYSRYRERLEEHIVPLLQRKVSYNWIALDANKNPISFNLKSYCQLFLESRRQIVRQYLDYRLANLKKQKEVEEAKLLVVRHLDEAITALRAPKPREYALPRFFKRYDSKPTEDSEQKYMRQTEVILKSSLNSLTRASEEKQRKELKRLKSEIKEVSDCIKDIDGVIYKELDSLKVYFDERRTSCPL